ncbi:hypothetical protein [Mycolicibacterium sp. S3B2]|uniref:hypothetical protein n=1 Tax=Mycolicibacterium sp. S3B2 TaxID=3415120 RepID=UPI003C7CCEFB
MTDLVYKQHFVAFFDILGFSEIVSADMTDEEAIEQIELLNGALTACRQMFSRQWSWEEDAFTVSMFSDCVCVAIPARWENLDAFFQIIAYLQSHFAVNGIAIRGAVTVGRYYSNDQLIFSSALVEAYKIESAKTTPPCIVVSPKLQQHIDKQRPKMNKRYAVTLDYYRRGYVFHDTDGVMFIDYLNFMPAADDNGEKLRLHRDWIAGNLAKFVGVESVHKKYRWLRDYHNRWCTEFESGWRDHQSLLIPNV